MPALTLGCKGCQRHQTGKDPAKKSPVRSHHCEDHGSRTWPEIHGALSEQLPTPGMVQSQNCKTQDKICKVQCPCRKGFPSSVKVQVGFCSSAALTRTQCRPTEIHLGASQRSSPTRGSWPQHRGEEENHLQGCVQKSRLSGSETPV